MPEVNGAAAPHVAIILGLEFPVSWPFSAGHICTEAEAKTLNQTRKENLGNNFRKRVVDALEADTKAGNTDESSKLAAEFADLDAKYVFTLAGVGAVRMDPIEREARNLAKDAVKQNLAAKGRKLSDIPTGMTKEEWEDKLETTISEISQRPEVIKIAKAQVAAKKKAIDATAVDLGLDAPQTEAAAE